MEKVLDKLSSYNVFNYLFPGVVFCVIADRYLAILLLQESIVNGLFLCYFTGLVISRIGSIVIETVLKKTGIVQFADYQSFVKAAKEDTKIEVLSESNNMYRTLLSVILILCIAGIGSHLAELHPGFIDFMEYLILPGLGLLFMFSYKKQTEYITKKVSIAIKDSNKEGAT